MNVDMKIPKIVIAIAGKAVDEHPDEISKAVKMAESEIRQLPEFQESVDALIHQAIKDLVYNARCAVSKTIRKNVHSGPAKVLAACSAVETSIAKSVFNYCIGTRTLGDMTGAELREIACREHRIAEGHMFNSRLAGRIAPMVPENKKVKNTLKENVVDRIFRECDPPGSSATKDTSPGEVFCETENPLARAF